jgi:hypothetical protein
MDMSAQSPVLSYEAALRLISRARAAVVVQIAEAYPAGRGLGIANTVLPGM